MNENSPLELALRRVFRPLARLSIARGLRFQDVQRILKLAFVDSAERDFTIDGKRLTDSRISLLSGLQRRDVKQISEDEALPPPSPRPLERLHSQLLATGKSSISYDEFDALARGLYQDVHPRTFLDELIRLGLVEKDGDALNIQSQAMIAGDDAQAVEIFAENLSAHMRSGVSNLLEDDKRLEQAVYARGLSEEDAAELQAMAREKARDWLLALNEEAIKMQARAKGNKDVRIGVYFNDRDQE